MNKFGLFGGTFDPVHWGHLQVAQIALHQLGLDGVIWLPTRTPLGKQSTGFSLRCRGVRLAIAPYPRFQLFQVPQQRNAAQDYAIFTLQSLQTLFPQTHWCWILGEDLWPTLPRWYGREILIPQCEWAIAPRPSSAGLPTDSLTHFPRFNPDQVIQQLAEQGISIRWQRLQMTPISISSHQIRQACQQSRPWQHLVPPKVAEWIIQENLYQQRPLEPSS